jgi:transcriptional regulator with XRE-family HTH domain
MPRLPKEENRDSCLRMLRIRLGTPKQPMPQSKLARTLGVSIETIKSLESKRLHKGIPSDAMMEQISREFGAVWSEEDKEWQMLSKTPYTQQQFKLWQTTGFDKVTEIDALCGTLIYLLQHVLNRRFISASDAVLRKLSELADQYGVPTNTREFLRSDVMTVPVWRDGKETRKAEDIVCFERRRDYVPQWQIPNRERLDYRFKLDELPPIKAPFSQSPQLIKPSSRPRSKRSAQVDKATRISAPQPR